MTSPVTPDSYTAGMTRTRPRTDGSLALRLDFGAPRRPATPIVSLKLARRADKYQVLEHRRRQAQITARRLLDVMEGD